MNLIADCITHSKCIIYDQKLRYFQRGVWVVCGITQNIFIFLNFNLSLRSLSPFLPLETFSFTMLSCHCFSHWLRCSDHRFCPPCSIDLIIVSLHHCQLPPQVSLTFSLSFVTLSHTFSLYFVHIFSPTDLPTNY